MTCVACGCYFIGTCGRQKYCKPRCSGLKECPRCKQLLSVTKFNNNRKHLDGLSGYCKPCLSEKNREWMTADPNRAVAHRKRMSLNAKVKVIGHYSNEQNECNCCQENIFEFLTIDHIHGRGNEHRRSIGIGAGRNFYHWLIVNDYPSGFQVLCYNCNMAKRATPECPHTYQTASI